ncbi:MAG: hypothetical protein ACREE6_09960, partial [Limisphaerales bacterium]
MIRLAAAVWLSLIGTAAVSAQINLSVQPGVQLIWVENATDTYQLQWSASPSANWAGLTASSGNGLTNTYFDPFPIGTRAYQLLDIVPGTPAAPALPSNGGFESGTGGSAGNWTVDSAAGGPVYGIRTNDNPHSGSYNFAISLA